MKESFHSFFIENTIAKIMALVIALFLWATVLGRRDFIQSKEMNLDFLTTEAQSVVAQTADRVRVTVSGPRSALRKFVEDPKSQSLTLDISNFGVGLMDVDITNQQIRTPLGVKVLSVRPNRIQVEVTNRK